MQARQQGVVPVRRHIPRYHFASGQYAREHSNVSRRACKVDVTLSAPATHLLKVPISSHTCPNSHATEWHVDAEYELPHYLFPRDHEDTRRNLGCRCLPVHPVRPVSSVLLSHVVSYISSRLADFGFNRGC